MEKADLTKLEAKIDKLTELMEQILAKFQTATIINKEPIVPISKDNKKAIFEQHMARRILARKHMRQLQKQFNLKQPPHENRILSFLQTKDPKVFDGLKRND